MVPMTRSLSASSTSAYERSLTVEAIDSPKKTTSGLCTLLVIPSSAQEGQDGTIKSEKSAPSRATYHTYICIKSKGERGEGEKKSLHRHQGSYVVVDLYVRTQVRKLAIEG